MNDNKREIHQSKYRYTPSEFSPTTGIAPEYHAIVDDVLSGHYSSALSGARELVSIGGHVGSLDEKYSYLLRYYVDGADDPSRHSFVLEIGRSLLHLVRRDQEIAPTSLVGRTRQVLEHLGASTPGYLPGLVRSLRRLLTIDSSDSQVTRDRYEQSDLLFEYLWVMPIEGSDADELWDLMMLPEAADTTVHLLGGLYLGLLDELSEHKLRLLCRLLSPELSPRVLGTLLPILLMIGRIYQRELLQLYPAEVEQVRHSIVAHDSIAHALRQAIVEIYHAYCTQRDHQIFVDHVVPQIRKLHERLDFSNATDIAARLREIQERMTGDEAAELQAMSEQALSRMRDLDATEHDTDYHTMCEMKRSPFFSRVSHWFLPFDPHHPDIDPMVSQALHRYSGLLFGGRRGVISSDLYSVATFPQWSMVVDQLSQLGDMLPTSETPIWGGAPTLVGSLREFVFGVYRFHYLHPDRDEVTNPFALEPYLLDGAFTSEPYLLHRDNLSAMAALMARDRHYAAAGQTYRRLIDEQGAEDGTAWRGVAVSCLVAQDREGALAALRRAMALEGMSRATVLKAMELLDGLGRSEEELRLITQAEETLPDEALPELLLRKSRLLHAAGDTTAALDAAFKALFLADGQQPQALLTLAVMLLSAQRAEDAHSRLLSAAFDETGSDEAERQWLVGVSLMALGKRREAFEVLLGVDPKLIAPEQRASYTALLTPFGVPVWEQQLILDSIAQHAAE